MAINFQNVTIAGGVLTVSGSPTSSGIYAVANEGGAATDDITNIVGLVAGNYEMIELWVQVDGDFWRLVHNPANGINLEQNQDFETFHVHDYIILRGIGPNAVKEVKRGRFGAL